MNSNNRPVIEGAEPAITSLNTNSSINGTQVINGMPVLISVTNSVSSAFTFFEKKLSSLVGEYVVARK